MLVLAIQGLLPVAIVFLTRVLVDRLAAAAGTGASWEQLQPIALPAGLMAGLLVLSGVLRAIDRLVRSAQAELVRDHISGLIHEKSAAVDLAHFESPEYHDLLYRARSDSHDRPVQLVQNLGALLQHTLTLSAMALVLTRFGWWVPLILLVSTLPALAVVSGNAIRHHRWSLSSTANTRRSWYYDWLLCTRESAAETRIFGLGPGFSSAFQSLRKKLRKGRFDLSLGEAVAEIAAAVFALLVTGSMVLWMVIRTAAGSATLGGLAMFFQAFSQGQALMRSLLESVGQVWGNTLFLDNLFRFLAIESTITDPTNPKSPIFDSPPSIHLRTVSFSYPNAEEKVFDDLDLEIEAASTAALLGVNGAGKTTLFKLLCRFYDPEGGAVEIGGIDLREMAVADARRQVSILFQEPVHYSETVRRSIALAEPNKDLSDASIERALEISGAREIVDRMPDGLDSMLGTWFSGGAELSVGEWQRLALARALVREAPVLLLDEPTSAMDSWAEAEWRQRLRQMAGKKTVLVITHRLTTAMHADRIFIMDRGTIVESGSHAELVTAGGRYQAAWDGQFGEL